MQDCSGKEVFRSVDEMLLILALCATLVLGSRQYISDDFRITHGILTRPNLGEDIEVNGVFDNGAEAKCVRKLAAKPRCDMPVLRLGIKDDHAAAPGKKSRDHGADAFA